MAKCVKCQKETCLNCKKNLTPALECKNFVTGEWDEHSWHCDNCDPEHKLVLSIG